MYYDSLVLLWQHETTRYLISMIVPHLSLLCASCYYWPSILKLVFSVPHTLLHIERKLWSICIDRVPQFLISKLWLQLSTVESFNGWRAYLYDGCWLEGGGNNGAQVATHRRTNTKLCGMGYNRSESNAEWNLVPNLLNLHQKSRDF